MRFGRRARAVAAGVGLTGLLAGVAAAAPVLVDFSNAGSAEILVDPAVGDSYLYEDVRPGVDALMTIVSATDVTAFDLDPGTLNDNTVVDSSATTSVFSDQAFVNTRLPNTGSGGGTPKFVTYRIDFRDATTGEPVTVSDVAISTKDLDGPDSEYVEFAGITRYCLATVNDIAVSTNPDGSYRFAGTAAQSGSSAVRGWAEVFYGPVSSIVVTAGQSDGWFTQIAQSFDAAGWGGTATTCTDVARPTYTLTYDANGATTGTVPAQTSGDGALTIAGNTGALALGPRTFAGWNSKEDGTGQSFPVGASYTPASDLTLFAQFPKVAQTITLPAVTTHPATGAAPAIGDAPFEVTATASSGLAVTLASTTPDICTVADSTVTLIALGDCTLTADQDGDADYEAAPQATTTFTVGEPLPAPVTPPGSAPVLSCTPPLIAGGVEVTCTVTGGDPEVDVLWSAERDGQDLRRGVRLGAEGRAVFTFIAPDGSGPLDVRLVGWGATVRLTVADAVVPTVVRAGGGPQDGPDERWGGVALALLLGVSAALRRRERLST